MLSRNSAKNKNLNNRNKNRNTRRNGNMNMSSMNNMSGNLKNTPALTPSPALNLQGANNMSNSPEMNLQGANNMSNSPEMNLQVANGMAGTTNMKMNMKMNMIMNPNTPNMSVETATTNDFKITYYNPDTKEKMVVENETRMTKENTEEIPYIKLSDTIIENMKSGKQYMLVMYDINAVGGTFVHMVVVYSQNKMRGVMKVKYLPPTPPVGSGDHKYIFELLDYEDNLEKKEDRASYFSAITSNRTLKKNLEKEPNIPNINQAAGDILAFYEKVGIVSSNKMKSMMVMAN